MPLTLTCGPKPDRQLANQMIDRGLADVVRLAALLRDDGIGGTGEHDRRRQVLWLEDDSGLLREHVIAGHVDRHRLAPHRFRRRRRIGRGIDRGGVDHAVEPPNRSVMAPQRVVNRLARRRDRARRPSPSRPTRARRPRWPRPRLPPKLRSAAITCAATLGDLQSRHRGRCRCRRRRPARSCG